MNLDSGYTSMGVSVPSDKAVAQLTGIIGTIFLLDQCS